MAWTEIESTTLTSDAASVAFSTGLTDYKFFRLTAFVKAVAGGQSRPIMRFNSDSGSNYSQQSIDAGSTTIAGTRDTGSTSLSMVRGNTLDAGTSGSFSVVIAKPDAGVKAQVIVRNGYDPSASIALQVIGGEWSNTAALISSITIEAAYNNFDTGSSFLLEGLSF